jgi:hypothetical protein
MSDRDQPQEFVEATSVKSRVSDAVSLQWIKYCRGRCASLSNVSTAEAATLRSSKVAAVLPFIKHASVLSFLRLAYKPQHSNVQ